MTKHTEQRLSIADTGTDGARSRLWAHVPSEGGVIIADFGLSKSLREETKKANARYARAAWNYCLGVSTEELELAIKRGGDLDDLRKAARQVVDLMWQLPKEQRPVGLEAALAELHRALRVTA